MPRFILPTCCLLLLSLTTARAEDAKPLAVFPMGDNRLPRGQLSLGGKEYECLFDTGTAVTWVSHRLRDVLGPAGEAVKGGTIRALPAASIGSLQIPAGTPVACGDFDHGRRIWGVQMDAIVGMDILSRCSLSLNFDDGVVSLHEPSYRPPQPTESIAMLCQLYPPNSSASLPFTLVQVNGQDATLLVDTGDLDEISLSKSLADGIYEHEPAALFTTMVARNHNGAHQVRVGLLGEVRWKDDRFSNIVFSERPNNEMDGTLGMTFLARYNATLLFAENEIRLSKSKWYDGQWWPVFHGMKIVVIGGRAVVFSVRHGTPAQRADIRPGDELDLPTDDPSTNKQLWSSAGRGPLELRVRRPPSRDFSTVQLADEARR